MKTIQTGSKVTMHFTMFLEDGSVADSTKANGLPGTVEIGDGTLAPGFEANLIGLNAGAKHKFTVVAADAFGESKPENIYVLPVAQFPSTLSIAPGVIVEFTQRNGSVMPGIIRKIDATGVTVDFNHPLADQPITFDIEILEVS